MKAASVRSAGLGSDSPASGERLFSKIRQSSTSQRNSPAKCGRPTVAGSRIFGFLGAQLDDADLDHKSGKRHHADSGERRMANEGSRHQDNQINATVDGLLVLAIVRAYNCAQVLPGQSKDFAPARHQATP